VSVAVASRAPLKYSVWVGLAKTMLTWNQVLSAVLVLLMAQE
jgi:hypothetical protein